MRILLISDYATPTGGAEIIMLGLRDALRTRGHDARLLSSSARPFATPSQADYYCFGTLSQLRGLTQIWNPSAYLHLKSILKDFHPDVVHIRLFLSQISPAILPLLRSYPTIYHAAWYRAICPLGTKLLPSGEDCQSPSGAACFTNNCIPFYALPSVLAQSRIMRLHWASFDSVVANSHFTGQRLASSGIPVNHVIWNGVAATPPSLVRSAQPTIVFAGRLVWEKGVDILLTAFQRARLQVPALRLCIAGDGPERASLEAQAKQLGLRDAVDFTGLLAKAEMEARFHDAWLQIVPSRWQEPFGLVAAEALMRGTPLIASNAGGLAEFVQHGVTGLLFPPGDCNALTGAILDLIGDPARSHTMGQRARQFALQNLDARIFVDRFIDLYGSLITNGGKAK